MVTDRVYVLHSAYPDGTWRGLSKCCGATGDATLVFSEREAAEQYLKDHDCDPYFRVVEVTLVVPGIRKPLDSAITEKVDEALLKGWSPTPS